jgi:hypothetical protein
MDKRVLVVSPGGCASKSFIEFLKSHVGEINCPNNSDTLKHSLPWSPQVNKYNPTHIIYVYGDLDKAIRSIFRREYAHGLYYKLHGLKVNSLPIPFYGFDEYISLVLASHTEPLGIINHINFWKKKNVFFIDYEKICINDSLSKFLNIDYNILNSFELLQRKSRRSINEIPEYISLITSFYNRLNLDKIAIPENIVPLPKSKISSNYIYKKKKIFFCTFGSDGYENALIRINQQAKESRFFTEIHIYNHKNTPGLDDHSDFIKENKRGYGYWIWKPLVILDVMKKANVNDIIVFADAGCEISNKNGRDKIYNKYITDVTTHAPHRLGFVINYREANWTKADLFNFLDLKDIKYTETNQIIAGIQILVNTEENKILMEKWLEIMTCNNYHFVDDSPSLTENDLYFKEHRHDQSVLSLLKKKYGYFPEIFEGLCPIETNKTRIY